MTRKLSGKRVYLLFRGIVVVISALFLITAFIQTWNYEDNQDSIASYLKKYEQCNDEERAMGIDSINRSCDIWMDLADGKSQGLYLSYGIALGLPALFFGSTALIRYLMPEEK